MMYDATTTNHPTPQPAPVKPTPETAEGIARSADEIRQTLADHTWAIDGLGDDLSLLVRYVPLYVLAAFTAGAALGAASVWIGGAL